MFTFKEFTKMRRWEFVHISQLFTDLFPSSFLSFHITTVLPVVSNKEHI